MWQAVRPGPHCWSARHVPAPFPGPSVPRAIPSQDQTFPGPDARIRRHRRSASYFSLPLGQPPPGLLPRPRCPESMRTNPSACPKTPGRRRAGVHVTATASPLRTAARPAAESMWSSPLGPVPGPYAAVSVCGARDGAGVPALILRASCSHLRSKHLPAPPSPTRPAGTSWAPDHVVGGLWVNAGSHAPTRAQTHALQLARKTHAPAAPRGHAHR